MAMAEQTKSAVGFATPGQKRRTNAIGTKIRSQFSDGFMFWMLSVKVAQASSLRLFGSQAGSSRYHEARYADGRDRA
jgi:hypothetical protein